MFRLPSGLLRLPRLSILGSRPGLFAFVGLAGAALGLGFVYLDVQRTRAIRAVYQDGYKAGQAALALDYERAARAAQVAGEAREREREAAIAKRLAGAGKAIAAAEKRAADALARIKRQDPLYETCLALPWPDDLRLHRAGGVLPSPMPAGGDGGGPDSRPAPALGARGVRPVGR